MQIALSNRSIARAGHNLARTGGNALTWALSLTAAVVGLMTLASILALPAMVAALVIGVSIGYRRAMATPLGNLARLVVRKAMRRTWRMVNHWLVRIWVLSIGSIYGAYHSTWLGEVSSFPFAIGKITLLLTLAWLVLHKKFDGVQSSKILSKNPLAYALVTCVLILSGVYIICNS